MITNIIFTQILVLFCSLCVFALNDKEETTYGKFPLVGKLSVLTGKLAVWTLPITILLAIWGII